MTTIPSNIVINASTVELRAASEPGRRAPAVSARACAGGTAGRAAAPGRRAIPARPRVARRWQRAPARLGRRILGAADERREVAHPVEQRRHLRQRIILPGKVGPGARPGPVFRPRGEAGLDRVERDVAGGGDVSFAVSPSFAAAKTWMAGPSPGPSPAMTTKTPICDRPSHKWRGQVGARTAPRARRVRRAARPDGSGCRSRRPAARRAGARRRSSRSGWSGGSAG